MKLFYFRSACVVLFSVMISALAGCSFFNKDDYDYKKAGTVRPLEIPPEFSAPELSETMALPPKPSSQSATYSETQSSTAGSRAIASDSILPEHDAIKLQRTGDRYWLQIKAPAQSVWPKVKQFWLDNEMTLSKENPATGVMETEWKDMRVSKKPDDGFVSSIGSFFSRFGGTGLRDKFRVRLERSAEGNETELYLTHMGLEEFVPNPDVGYDGSEWRSRPRDPEIEVELIKQLMAYLGVPGQGIEVVQGGVVSGGPPVQLIDSVVDGQSLLLQDVFARAWRRIGLALSKAGIEIESQDRALGVYQIEYHNPDKETGFFAKLAFWSDEESDPIHYKVLVVEKGSTTGVRILDMDNKPQNSETAKKILALLEEKLN